MGKFLDWLFNVSSDDAMAVAGMRAIPLKVTQGDGAAPAISDDKIAHAKWRLDAIKRTIDQDDEGRISERHMAEFRAEIRDHAHTLATAGVITDEDAATLVRHGKGAKL